MILLPPGCSAPNRDDDRGKYVVVGHKWGAGVSAAGDEWRKWRLKASGRSASRRRLSRRIVPCRAVPCRAVPHAASLQIHRRLRGRRASSNNRSRIIKAAAGNDVGNVVGGCCGRVQK